MVLEALRGYLQVASGLTEVTRQRARTVAKALVAQGGAAVEQVAPGQVKEQVQAIAEELVATSKANRDMLLGLVQSEVERAVSRLGFAPKDEVAKVSRTVDRLERRLSTVEEKVAARGATPTKAPSVKKAATKEPATKRATGAASAKNATSKPSPVRKAAVKESPVKKAATKQTATKASPVNKAAVEEAPAKRSAAGRAAKTATAADQTPTTSAEPTTAPPSPTEGGGTSTA